MCVSFEIAVKPYLKKFLNTKYGPEAVVSKKTRIGLILIELLDSKIDRPGIDITGCTEKYTIKVSERYFNIKGFNVSFNKKKFLAVYLDKQFTEELRSFVDLQLSMGVPAMKAMRIFLKYYSISENEIKLDSVYRNYQRYSDENILSKRSNNISTKMY
jgi:hypothetical protein